jgi:hypothetical protein
VIGYLAWPYLTLWRLDRALVRDDRTDLAALVDLPAMRDEIRRQINKDAQGALVPFSDPFISWLEEAIRRNGTAALDRQVTLDWVRGHLLAHSPPGAALAPALSWAFFDDPLHFSLRIGAETDGPVRVRLAFNGLGWRVAALSY